MLKKIFSNKILFSYTAIILFFVLLKLILHLVFITKYGFSGKELYFIESGKNLDLAFVDHPVLPSLLIKIITSIFGYSIESVRLLPIIFGAISLILSGMIIKLFGGGRFGLLFGLTAILFSTILLQTNHIFSPVSLDQLLLLFFFYCLMHFKDKNNEIYLIMGAITAGLAFNNSYYNLIIFSVLFLWFFVQNKKQISGKLKVWLAIFIPAILFIPNLLWQIFNDFPTAKYIAANIKFSFDLGLLIDFIDKQFWALHPYTFTIIIIGLLGLIFQKRFKEINSIWVTFVTLVIAKVLFNLSEQALITFYPLMIAVSAAVISLNLANNKLLWLRYSLTSFLLIGYFILLPMAIPMLQIETYWKYADKLELGIPSNEIRTKGKLAPHYADMFGWRTMAEVTVRVFESLPDTDKENWGIMTGDYYQASAVNFFGNKYGIPKAISAKSNAWYWGNNKQTFETMIVFGSGLLDNLELFDVVEPVEIISSEYAAPHQNNLPIYICKKPKLKAQILWEKARRF